MAGFSPFHRKSGFDDFAKHRAPVRFRKLMTASNRAHLAAGFEQTIATRTSPMFGAEIAESQSLKGARTASFGAALRQAEPKRPAGLARFFVRDAEFARRDQPKGGKR